jgi:hypothetical protein
VRQLHDDFCSLEGVVPDGTPASTSSRGGFTMGPVLVVVATGPVDGGISTEPAPPADGGAPAEPASGVPASATHPSMRACEHVESEAWQVSVVHGLPSSQFASIVQQLLAAW